MWASQVALVIKNPPTNAGAAAAAAKSLQSCPTLWDPIADDAGTIADQEDALEKRMATHSSILAWRAPCTEEPGGL